MDNSISLRYRINNGEKIKCRACGEGIYVPIGKNNGNNYWFKCSKCGETIHFTPNIEIK